MITHSVVLVILILLNAFFASSEVAIISLSPIKVRKLAKYGRRGQTLSALFHNSGKFLATVQVGVTLAGFLASAFAADSFSDPVAELLQKLPWPAFSLVVWNKIAVVAITLALSFISLVFGELVPKQIALRYQAAVALNVALPIRFLSWIATPFVWILEHSVECVMKIFGKPKRAQKVTEEEIRMLIGIGAEDGAIAPHERNLIENVFELNDITCGEVMTRRGAIAALDVAAPPEQVEQFLLRWSYAVYPVYQGTIDNIIGILDASSYFKAKIKGAPTDLAKLIRKPHFAPAAAKIAGMLRSMQAERSEIAVLLDEFGGTAGIITLEDILEELVGSLHGNANPEESLIRKGPGVWEAGGLVRLSEIEKLLSVDLPDEHFDTLGGYLMEHLDKLPKPGDQVKIGDAVASVLSVKERRVELVRIEQEPNAGTPSGDENEGKANRAITEKR